VIHLFGSTVFVGHTGSDAFRFLAVPTPRSERTEAAPASLPVRVVDPEAVAPRTAPPIEIVLPAGSIIRVPFGFDPRTLSDVLAALGGRHTSHSRSGGNVQNGMFRILFQFPK